MAYRFDGETFRPAAKTYLGRLGAAARATGVERIDEGVIEVLLQVHQQGDQECCPSGRHRQAYVLQDGNLRRAAARQLNGRRAGGPDESAQGAAGAAAHPLVTAAGHLVRRCGPPRAAICAEALGPRLCSSARQGSGRNLHIAADCATISLWDG